MGSSLSIWTKKFATSLTRLQDTKLQKITATEKGELVLSVFKPNDDKSLVILSMKQGESGISTSPVKPPSLDKPNSFVQIARKYVQGRRISHCYLTISPICIVIEFMETPATFENAAEMNQGPNCFILDLDNKPPRLVLAKKYAHVPERYEEQCAQNFSFHDCFFESWCEWTIQNTKTKRRACFELPIVGYCSLLTGLDPAVKPRDDTRTLRDDTWTLRDDTRTLRDDTRTLRDDTRTLRDDTRTLRDDTRTLRDDKGDNVSSTNSRMSSPGSTGGSNESVKEITKENADPLAAFPTEIRRVIRTRVQFLERRLRKQKQDLPSEANILFLQKQGEELKLSPTPLPKGVLDKIYKQIDKLKRRLQELEMRIAQGEAVLKRYKELFNQMPDALEPNALLPRICEALGLSSNDLKKAKKSRVKVQKRDPFYSFLTSQGEFIRVARSAEDGDAMIKMMPSNHIWLHVLTGEGSHVWLEKPKGAKNVSAKSIREAAILAVHYSKHSKAQSAEVQITRRADIEKKKNLPVGKVLVRRCETLNIKYDRSELQKIRNFE